MTVRAPGVTSILQAVERRGETDSRPSYFVHVVLPLLITVIAVLIVLAVLIWQIGSIPSGVEGVPSQAVGAIVVAVVVAVLAIVGAAVLTFRGWYLLIKRRNDHLARDQILRRGLVDYCRRVAERDGSDRAGEHLEAMERIHNEGLLEENERPTAVHLILYVITNGLWGLYNLHFLLKDFPRHAHRQGRFVREARALFEEVGRDPDEIPPVEPVQERSYLLSVALWIFLPVAGGLLVTWWLYDDPLDHFDRQWDHEDALLELVEEEEEDGIGGEPPTSGPEEDEDGEERDEAEPEDEPGDAEEEPEFTVWTCPECSKKYKVPPKRPVRVTCKNCEHQEILEE